jgi:hypothetical protein
MSVDELDLQYGLELAFDRRSNAWLLEGRLGEAAVERLARLARVDAASFNALQESWSGPGQSTRLAYCPSCLFLNPLDVTSPCWKQEWLAPSASECAIHARPLRQMSITSLRTCDNFDKLLRLISRRERPRRAQDNRTQRPR